MVLQVLLKFLIDHIAHLFAAGVVVSYAQSNKSNLVQGPLQRFLEGVFFSM